jgi:tetratricopeptide (TPR) repeat protein
MVTVLNRFQVLWGIDVTSMRLSQSFSYPETTLTVKQPKKSSRTWFMTSTDMTGTETTAHSQVETLHAKFLFDARTERYRRGHAESPEVLHYQNLALLFVSELIDRNPQDKISLYNRGALLTSIGKIQDAIRDFDCALALDREFALVYANRASALSMIDQTDKALTDYDTALAIEPKLEVALIGRGALLMHSGEFEKAAKDFTLALELNPDKPELRMLRANARYSLNQYERSTEDTDYVLRLYPAHAGAQVQKGCLEAIKGNYRSALIHLDKAAELNSRDARVYLSRAQVHKFFGNDSDYHHDLNTAYELDSTLGSSR